MKYKSYPEYKESGIQWIGEIPEEWAIRKFSSFGFFSSSGINKKTESNEPLVKMVNYTDIYGNDSLVIDSKRDLMIVSCHREKIIFCNLKKGDIVFTPSSETEEDIGLSAAIFENLKNTVFSYHVIKFRTIIKINLYYKKYIGNNHFVLSQFSRICKGTTRKILTHNDFNIILTLLPPLQEQAIIANFLDKKTAEIDKLIEKDKKLIELLKEKRIALINHTVTKGLPVCHTQTGLDPNVKMKDSEIQLIEKIPENWNAMKLKHIVSKKITDGPHETPEFVDEGVPFISAEAIKKDKIDFSKIRGYITKQVHKIYCAKCKPRKDDIFLIKSGATTGNVAIVETNDEFSIWSPLALIRSNKEKILPKLLYYILLTDYFKKTIELSWSFGTQQNIGMSVIENLNIIIPSISQQNYLLDYLNQATAKIDKTIQKIEQKIELLEKYKKSLIHHAVTGKIDVREVKI